MADIKTRDAVKGTIKTLDKAAVAGERMKSAYTKTKDKAEQGYYAEENSPTEYAADKVSHASGRIKDEGIHQFNKQGQKNAEATRENIGKAKDKIADFKAKRAKKAAEQKTMRNKAGQNAMRTMGQDGLQEIQGTASRPAVSATSTKTETPQTAANSLIKTRQQGKRTIKTTARNAEKTVKTTAKGTVKATEKGVKTAKATSIRSRPQRRRRKRRKHLPKPPRKRHRRRKPPQRRQPKRRKPRSRRPLRRSRRLLQGLRR